MSRLPRPGDVVCHQPTGTVAPVKWVSDHGDLCFVYLDCDEAYPQVMAADCDIVEEGEKRVPSE